MKRKKIELLIGVLLGNSPTTKKSALIADTYRHCPYCVSYTSTGCTVVGIFSLPTDHRWWLQWVAENPEETLGLKCANVFFTQSVEAFSPWSRGNVKPNLEQAPCGAECLECPKYNKECKGCPATLNYLVS